MDMADICRFGHKHTQIYKNRELKIFAAKGPHNFVTASIQPPVHTPYFELCMLANAYAGISVIVKLHSQS